jgi:hypothetical protein
MWSVLSQRGVGIKRYIVSKGFIAAIEDGGEPAVVTGSVS